MSPLLLLLPLLLVRVGGVGTLQSVHGQGPPNFLANIERSFSAGPSFMPSEFVRCSSVSSGSPAPSML
uniref:Putative secreted peptide n=1 Tax=Anopheles braziliensis TaxID=58242 RepID=A0A2M3ZTU3_9DIPT